MEKCIFVLKKTSRPKIRNGSTVSGIGHPCMPFFTHVILWFLLPPFPPTFIDASNNQHKMVHVPKYVDYSLYHLFFLTRFLISGEVFSFSNFLSVRRCGRFSRFFSLLSCVSSTHISGMRCSSSSIYSNKGPGVFNFALSFCYTRTKSRSMSNLTHQKTHCSEEDSL